VRSTNTRLRLRSFVSPTRRLNFHAGRLTLPVLLTSALVDPSRDNKRGRRPKGAFQFCPIRSSCPFFCGAASFLSDSVSYSDVDLTSGAIQLLRTGSRDVLLLLLLSPDDDVTPARQSPDNVPRYKTAPPWARAIRRDLVSTFRLFASAL